MKMRIKRTVCLLIAVVLCFSLAGCKELDRARALHGILQEDGTILLNGDVYVPLPQSEDFNPPMDYNEMVSITEPDVPVLLKNAFSDLLFFYSEEGIIKDGHLLGEYGVYYCLEKDYAALAARIEAGGQLSGMRYLYAYWDPQTDEVSDKAFYLTEEQVNTVKQVLTTVQPQEVDGIDGEYTVQLEWCSADGLFSRNLGELYRYNSHWGIANWEENKSGMTLYEVPAEYNSIFDNIVAAYDANEEAYYGSW